MAVETRMKTESGFTEQWMWMTDFRTHSWFGAVKMLR